VFPTECRQRYTTYKGDFFVTLGWWLNGLQQPSVEKCLGAIPIMVKVNFLAMFWFIILSVSDIGRKTWEIITSFRANFAT